MANLAKKESAQLEQVPDYLKHAGPAQGTETMSSEDMVVPRISICQANTPQRKKQDASYIEGLDEGMIFNTVSGEIYGTELTVVPLFFFRQRLYLGPMEEGGGVRCQSLNGKDGGRLHPSDCATCPHAQFKNDEEDSRPDCNLLLCYMCLLPGANQVAALSLKSTSLKAAKQLNAQIRMSNLDMFARTLKLTSVSMTRQQFQFWGPKLQLGDFVSKELYDAARALFSDLRGKNINLDTKGLDDEGQGPIDEKGIPF